MALPISVTYTFATATSAIPLSQLDANFTTVVNGVNGIGNGTNSLSNVVITGGTIDGTTIGATTSSTGRFSTVTATTLNAATHRSDTSLTFQTNGTTTAMTVDASQNVGIGTSSPAAKLQVSGNSISNNHYFGTTTAAAGTIASDTGAAGAKIVFYGTTSGGGGTLDLYAGAAPIQFSTNSAERMRIDASGNVGVGTSSPGYKLDVAGTIRGRSDFYFGWQNGVSAGLWWSTANYAVPALQGLTSAGGVGDICMQPGGGNLLVNRTSQAGFTSVISSTNNGRSTTGALYGEGTNANFFVLGLIGNNASFNDYVIYDESTRSASSAYYFMTCRSSAGASPDVEFNLRGDGNAYADGTWNNNGADYAEFFESANGQALTLGASVVLENNKVREATDQDPASSIIGVVRPKEPSKASMMIGNTAWNKWADKYLTDDFDRYIMEDHDVVEWVDEDGKEHSYESHAIPDGIMVPANAVVKTHDSKGNRFQHYKLNPAWDKDAEYINRENRQEWNIIGLLGQVKVLNDRPLGDRWVKMRDVSASVAEYMIR
jgi:hypothetical protein